MWVSACARVAGVGVQRLPGGWFVNDASIAANMARRERLAHGVARDMGVLKHEAVLSTSSLQNLYSSCISGLIIIPIPRSESSL